MIRIEKYLEKDYIVYVAQTLLIYDMHICLYKIDQKENVEHTHMTLFYLSLKPVFYFIDCLVSLCFYFTTRTPLKMHY